MPLAPEPLPESCKTIVEPAALPLVTETPLPSSLKYACAPFSQSIESSPSLNSRVISVLGLFVNAALLMNGGSMFCVSVDP